MLRLLTKTKPDGTRYERRPQIIAQIDALVALDRGTVLKQCAITDRKHPNYVASETLLYFLRDTRSDNRDDHFERLFRLLLARVQSTLVVAVRDSQYRNADEIRTEILSDLSGIIGLDHTQPSDKLDFFEVGFDGALHKLKIDWLRKLGPQRLKTDPLDDPQTGEIAASVEDAAQDFFHRSASALDDPAFRSALFAAIDELPDDERRVVGLILKGLPIDAKDENTVTIARVLDCTERTVRNRRDRATAKLRAALKEYES